MEGSVLQGWDIQVIAGSHYDTDGFYSVQTDGYGGIQAGIAAAEVHHPYGFLSTALDPDKGPDGSIGLGCNVLKTYEGGKPHIFPLGGDPRVTPLLPRVEKGGAIQYGAKGNFVRTHASGDISLFTTDDGTVNGKSIFYQVTTTGHRLQSPWGRSELGADGYYLTHLSGARIDMGGVSGGLLGPLSSIIDSYVSLSAAAVRLEGTFIALGPTVSVIPPQPVAKATATELLLGTIATALGSINAALVGIDATKTGPTTPATAAATAAIQSTISAITAALVPLSATSIASTSTTVV